MWSVLISNSRKNIHDKTQRILFTKITIYFFHRNAFGKTYSYNSDQIILTHKAVSKLNLTVQIVL